MDDEIQPDLVFDVGAHRGEDSSYYLRRGFRVVSVECDPGNVALLRSRFEREIGEGRLTLIDRAVAPASGQVKFFKNKNVSIWGTTEPSFAERFQTLGTEIEEIVVEAINADDLFCSYGIPFYLKIDIEGSDLLVVDALQHFESRPAYLSLESDSVCFEKLRQEFAALRGLGYNKFKLSPQHLVSRQKIPALSPHGQFIEHTFDPASSGLFGEDLDGEWIDEREALLRYGPIFVLYHLNLAIRSNLLCGSLGEFLKAYGYEEYFGWYDTHARHSCISQMNVRYPPAVAERQKLQELLANSRTANAEASARCEWLNLELQERATQISQLQADSAKLRAELAERTSDNEHVRRQIDSIHSSICWRITWPIRWLHMQANRSRRLLSRVHLVR
jgi:FkbM family methyltransferase